jgi:hypothetical protein
VRIDKLTRLRQPENLFVLTATGLFIFSMTTSRILDVHFHDTMYVISITHFVWALVILLLIGWGFYKLIHRFLWTSVLSWIHIASTCFFFAACATMYLWVDLVLPPVQSEIATWRTFGKEAVAVRNMAILGLSILALS